jgi:predicted permease
MRTGLRVIRRNPAFAAAAILTLALGIGVNTAVFSVINAVLLRPLPFRNPDRLVMLWETHPEFHLLQASVPDYEDWRALTHSYGQMAAYTLQAMNKATLTGQGPPLQIQATMVSPELFPLLGISPLVGRTLSATDRQVVLISEHIWRTRFGADRNVPGRVIRFDREPFTIAGVVPQALAFPPWADAWIPIALIEPELRATRRFHPLEVIGQLRPGVSELQAQAELQAIARRNAVAYSATNGNIGASVIPINAYITGSVRPALIVVWSAVALVLFIACTNAALLMLARAESVSRDASIRTALGAPANRLIRDALSESIAISIVGGMAGLALAGALLPVLRSLAIGQVPHVESVAMDVRVFIFGFALALVSGALFGIVPGMRAARAGLAGIVRGAGVKSHRNTGSVLIAAEVALAVTVLIAAGLLLRSYSALLGTDPGFRTRGILTANISTPGRDSDKTTQLYRNEIYPRLRALPGVTEVALTNCVPASLAPTERSRFATRFGVPGVAYASGDFPVAQTRWVTPEYFGVMEIALRSGRLLRTGDRGYLINETLARVYFPNMNPAGKSLLMGVTEPHPAEVPIVGVVADVRELGLDMPAPPTIYSIGISNQIVLRTRGIIPAEAIERAISAASPEIAIGRVRTAAEIISESLARRRFSLYLLSAFAALAAALCGVGIYGVAAYSVARRTREFGLRIALGARASAIVALIAGQSFASVIVGLLCGIAGALVLTRLMTAMLYGVAPGDPITFAGACGFLAAAAIVAIAIPTFRAVRISAMEALREE